MRVRACVSGSAACLSIASIDPSSSAQSLSLSPFSFALPAVQCPLVVLGS